MRQEGIALTRAVLLTTLTSKAVVISIFDEDSDVELPKVTLEPPKEVVCGLALHLRPPSF